MLSTISRPRPKTADSAPRLVRTKIDSEKIGLLIGPGGKNIRGIQEDEGVSIDVEEDGTVTIAARTRPRSRGHWTGSRRVRPRSGRPDLSRHGDERQGFWRVRGNPAGQGRAVSHQRALERVVSSVGDVCRVGDAMDVKVIAVDEQDRVKLSASRDGGVGRRRQGQW